MERNSSTGFAAHLRGGRSQFIWRDEMVWGSRPLETWLQALAAHALVKPDKIALDFEGDTVTFATLEADSNRMANALAGLGVAKGDTVVVLLDNSYDQVLTLAAVNKLGAIWVPVNTVYCGEFLRYQIADAGAKLAICEDECLANVFAVAGELPMLAQVVVRGWSEARQDGLDVCSLDAVRGTNAAPPEVQVGPADISCLIYTSGTTGPSKGCMISHNYLCANGRRRNVSVPPQPGGVTWSCLPMFHIAALGAVLMANLLAGETTSVARRFSVSGFWEEIERSQARSIVILASMLPLIAQAPHEPAMERCKGQLKVVTGVPLTAIDRQIWQERFGVEVMNSFAYGQTEANLVTLLPWGAAAPGLDSMGPPSEDFDMMVIDDAGNPVPIGDPGELVVRPRQPLTMFSGYWNRPADTLAAMDGLWWHTGDMARFDDQGYLYFVDRKKDYLRSRGENISSFEVEAAMMRHEEVAEVAFHAVTLPAGGEDAIKASIVRRPGSGLSERELFDWAMEAMPYFAVPRFIEFRSELPKTPTGKVQKQELRAEGVTPATWDCEAEGLVIRRRRGKAA